jgi:acyl-CoA dehydrogenase family member 10
MLTARGRIRLTYLLPIRSVSSSASPTTELRKALNEEGLKQYLIAHKIFASDGGNITLSQFSHGQSNPTFVATCNHTGHKVVVRKQPDGKLLQGAHAVDREFRIMTAMQQGNVLKVPNMRAYCSDPSILGTPFYVYDYVHGRFFNRVDLHKVDKAERKQLYFSMFDSMARLHAADIDAIGLSDYGVRREVPSSVSNTADSKKPFVPYILRQLRTWTKQYKATETEPIKEMDYLIDQLPILFPAHSSEKQSTVVHGDFRLDNMIFVENSSDVAAVLDWELSTLGDHLSDLSYNLMVYFLDPKNPFLRGLRGLDLAEMNIPTIEESVEYYGSRLKHYSNNRLAGPSMAELDYYMAFSFFRSCAILQGVYKRSLQGNASATNADLALTMAKETARLGEGFLLKYQKSSMKRSSSSPSSSFPASVSASSSAFRPLGATKSDRILSTNIPSIFKAAMSGRALELHGNLVEFMNSKVLIAEHEILSHSYTSSDKWTHIHPLVEQLKQEAKKKG